MRQLAAVRVEELGYPSATTHGTGGGSGLPSATTHGTGGGSGLPSATTHGTGGGSGLPSAMLTLLLKLTMTLSGVTINAARTKSATYNLFLFTLEPPRLTMNGNKKD
jgi:hypothetical protein